MLEQIIKGDAGSGKTTKISEIISTTPSIVVAPTNKAVKVLQSKGVPAKTIHKTFFKSVKTGEIVIKQYPVIDQTTNRPMLDILGNAVYEDREEDVYSYQFAPEGIIESGKTIIIDESSMVPAELWADILTIPNPIIIVGDEKQLPPIESALDGLRGDLKKAIESNDKDEINFIKEQLSKIEPYENFFKQVPATTHLKVRHRQDDDGDIYKVAVNTALSKGTFPFEFVSQNQKEFCELACLDLDFYNIDILDQAILNELSQRDVVITYRNSVCKLLNTAIRSLKFKKELSKLPKDKQQLPIVGDRLYIDTTYSIEKDLDNGKKVKVDILTKGDIVTIHNVIHHDGNNNLLYIDVKTSEGFIKENIPLSLGFVNSETTPRKIPKVYASYAYVLTCHKTQGSQWQHVAIIEECHYMLDPRYDAEMARQWRYTASTRASDTLLVIKAKGVDKLVKTPSKRK